MSATVAETVWYQEDSASPLTVAKPASFGAGQMLVVAIVQHNNPSAQTDLTTPAGWTFQGALDGTLVDGKVFSYVFTGSDPASWDFPYKSTADVVAGLFRITGADVATPTLVVSTTPATVTSPMDSPSLTPTGTDDLLLALISDLCNGTVLAATFPSGMTDLGLGEVTGHFMSSRAAYQQLSSGSATGVRTWTSVSPTGVEGGTWTVAVKSAAAGGASSTPSPIVVSTTSRPRPTTPIVLRSALQDDPQLTTPAPVVVASPTRRAPTYPIISRSSLVDVLVTASTPGPLVVTPVPQRNLGRQPIVQRGALQDDPVLTTPAPVVVTATVVRPVYPPIISRSSLVDVAVVTSSTPTPVVVTPIPARPGPGVQLVLRGALQDDPQLTTPAPVVVTAPSPPRPARALVLRGSLQDDPAGTAPVVVAAPRRPVPGLAIVSRSSLVDVVLVVGGTAPIVIAAPSPRAGGRALVYAAPQPAVPAGLASGTLTSTSSSPGLAGSSATARLASTSSAAALASSSGGDQ